MVIVKDNHAVIKFGTGDINIHLCLDDMNNGLLILENGEPGYIGVHHDNKYGQDVIRSDVIISFTRTESIDIVVDRLLKLKDVMLNSDAQPIAIQSFESGCFKLLKQS